MANFSDYSNITTPFDISLIYFLLSDGVSVTKGSIQTILENSYIWGAGTPVSSVTPDFIGQNYLDTDSNIWYKSYGTEDTEWATGSGDTTSTGGTSATMTLTNIISSALASGAGIYFTAQGAKHTFQLYRDNSETGTVTVIVDIEASNNTTDWLTIYTLTLSSDEDSTGFDIEAPWGYYRANVISADINSPITVTMGEI